MKLLKMLKSSIVSHHMGGASLPQHLLSLARQHPEDVQLEINEVDQCNGKVPMHYALESGNINVLRVLLSLHAHSDVEDNNGLRPEDLVPRVQDKVAHAIEKRMHKLSAAYDILLRCFMQMQRIYDKSTVSLMSALHQETTSAVIVLGNSMQKQQWIKTQVNNSTRDVSLLHQRPRDEEDALLMPDMFFAEDNTTVWIDIPVYALSNVLLDDVMRYTSKKVLQQSVDGIKSLVVFIDSSLIVGDDFKGLKHLIIQAGEYILSQFVDYTQCIVILQGSDIQTLKKMLYRKVDMLRKGCQYADESSSDISDALRAGCRIFYRDIDHTVEYRQEHVIGSKEYEVLHEYLAHLHITSIYNKVVAWQACDTTDLMDRIKDTLVLEHVIYKEIYNFYMKKNTCNPENPHEVVLCAVTGESDTGRELLRIFHNLSHQRQCIAACLEKMMHHYQEMSRNCNAVSSDTHAALMTQHFLYIIQNINNSIVRN